MQGEFALFVKQFFADEFLLPQRITDFAAQARGFALVVIGNAVDGVAVGLDGDKTVHNRPQTVTVHRQDDLTDFAVIAFYQVNLGVFGTAFDAGQIVFQV